MLSNTKLRTKLAAIAAPPMLVLALVAGYGAYVTFLQNSMSSTELRSGLRLISIMAIVGMIASILAVLAMRKRIMAPIEEVTAGAVEIAENRLPLLIEGLRNPSAEIPEFETIPFTQGNELGALAAALNQVQVSAAAISAEQKNIFKRGISDLVVNLARRNQSLLDRQIESIDRLESDEEDPDRLEQLFSLDHLATRMRRNAESLLVLAGSEPARRRGGPVAVADVLRVAMSEIEDYRKVQLTNMEHAEIGAQSAVDLAHLMSELMENATQFSPPDTIVEVKGAVDNTGAYVIGIIDHGIGMNDEQLLAANELLRDPPDLGIARSRSLGFLVIGQLSKRLGVGVELVKTAGSGTTGIVVVPAHLLAGAERRSVQDHATQSPAALDNSGDHAAPASWDQPVLTAPQDQAVPLASPEGWDQPVDMPAPAPAPAPAFEAPISQAPSFETPPPAPAPISWDQPVPAPAPAFEAEAPALAPSFEVPPPAPSFEAPPFEASAPVEETSVWDQPAPAQAFDAPFSEPSTPAPAPSVWDLPAPAPTLESPAWEPEAAPAPAPSFEAPAWEPAAPEPSFEAPAFEAAFEAPAYDAHAPESSGPVWEQPDNRFSDPGADHVGLAPEPAPSADYIPGWDDPPEAQPEPHQHQAPAPAPAPAPSFEAPAWEPAAPAHSDSVAAAFQTPVPGQFAPPSRLEQAIPTGDSFDEGVQELLEPKARTGAGLARRDRSASQAPTSEGRPVAASVRSPDEVRNMLARYRSGLKGNPNGEQQ